MVRDSLLLVFFTPTIIIAVSLSMVAFRKFLVKILKNKKEINKNVEMKKKSNCYIKNGKMFQEICKA